MYYAFVVFSLFLFFFRGFLYVVPIACQTRKILFTVFSQMFFFSPTLFQANGLGMVTASYHYIFMDLVKYLYIFTFEMQKK